jgi:hypothetical protein
MVTQGNKCDEILMSVNKCEIKKAKFDELEEKI